MAKKKLHVLQAELAKAVKAFNAATSTMTGAESSKKRQAIKSLRAMVQARLIEGANACSECDLMPLGLEQPAPREAVWYEVGCLSSTTDCPTRHSKGKSVEEAVDNWNNEIYFVRSGKLVVTGA